MSYNIHTWLQAARKKLLDLEHITTSLLDGQLILTKVLACSRADLYTHPDYILKKSELLLADKYLRERSLGKPLAYILGYQEFWSKKFFVTEDVLIPRAETELLIEKLLDLNINNNINLLDLGTGSGILAITMAILKPSWQITAVDKSSKALLVAKANAKLHQCNNIKFIHSNWFSNLNNHNKFDIIISNPPYIAAHDSNLLAADLQYEPKTALVSGNIGLDDIKIILTNVNNYLKQSGYLLLEFGYNQRKEISKLINNLPEPNNFRIIKFFKDLANHDRMLFLKK